MKVLKIIFSYLLVIVLLFAIPSVCLLYIFNAFLDKSTINDIMNSLVKTTINSSEYDEKTYIHTFLDETLDSTEVPKEILDYINFDSINESLSSYYSDFIKYELGMLEASDLKIDDLKEKINEAANNYQKETGNTVDTDFMNEYLDEMNNKIKDKDNIPNYDQYSKYLKQIGELINPINIFKLLGIILLCIILLIIINKQVRFPIKVLIPIMLLNTIGLGAITYVVKNVVTFNTVLVTEIIKTLTKVVDRVTITSAIITIILIIANIILKKIELKRQNPLLKMPY